MLETRYPIRRGDYEWVVFTLALANDLHVYKLSKVLGCSQDTAIRKLHDLEERGFLKKRVEKMGRRKSILYSFDISSKTFNKMLPNDVLTMKFIESKGFKDSVYHYIKTRYAKELKLAKEGYESENLTKFIKEVNMISPRDLEFIAREVYHQYLFMGVAIYGDFNGKNILENTLSSEERELLQKITLNYVKELKSP